MIFVVCVIKVIKVISPVCICLRRPDFLSSYQWSLTRIFFRIRILGSLNLSYEPGFGRPIINGSGSYLPFLWQMKKICCWVPYVGIKQFFIIFNCSIYFLEVSSSLDNVVRLRFRNLNLEFKDLDPGGHLIRDPSDPDPEHYCTALQLHLCLNSLKTFCNGAGSNLVLVQSVKFNKSCLRRYLQGKPRGICWVEIVLHSIVL